MAAFLGMNLQQTQKLVMTPQLKLALRVLQLPALALRDYIEQELEVNPALEVAEGEVSALKASPAPDATSLARELASWRLGEVAGPRVERWKVESAAEESAADLTLQEHLRLQVAVTGWPVCDRRRVLYLAGNLDENGYLAAPLPLLARDLGIDEAEADRLLGLLQQLEPTGVGARDLRECLLLQLKTRPEAGDLARWLVTDHLEDMAAGRWAALTRQSGATLAQLEKARAAILALEPKPGRAYASGSDAVRALPDAFVERVGGEYVVVLNDPGLPRLILSPAYGQALATGDEAARHYLEERLQAGLWFLRALEQRRVTLYRIIEAVMRWQRGYLDHGAEGLRPLTLRAIGDELSLHESTVSRAVQGKYVQTPQGLVPLRSFFSSGVDGPGGEGISAASVKRRIKRMVSGEDPRHPLSDDAICSMLNAEGIALARRTVGKYRQELGVPTAARRRQLA